jgi:hypothetical protein
VAGVPPRANASAVLLLVVGAACARAPAAPGAGGVPVEAGGWRRVPLGLCEDYPEETRSLDEVRADLDLLARAGAEVLRVSMGWDELEPEKDRHDFAFWDQVIQLAEERRVRLLPYVAYTPAWNAEGGGAREDFWRRPPRDSGEFGQLMETLASRYRGRIGSWELWNEPDNLDYWRGTPAEYATLLRAGAEGVRRGDPAARVVSGGLAGGVPFLRTLFETTDARRHVDVVNAHAYYETWNGEPIERLTSYLAELARLAEGRPVWLAEVGYSNYRSGAVVSPHYRARYRHEHTLAFQADVLVRTVALALASPHVALVAWYEVKDPRPVDQVIGDVNNRHLGVAFLDHRPKPALAALAFLQRLFRAGFRPLDAALELETGAATPVEAHAFLLADGAALLIAWLPTNVPGAAPAAARTGDELDERRARMTVALPCSAGAEATAHDPAGRLQARLPVVRAGDRLRLGPVEVKGGVVTLATVPACQPARR